MPTCSKCGTFLGTAEKECPSCHVPVNSLAVRGPRINVDKPRSFEIFDKEAPGQMPILTVNARNRTEALEEAYKQLEPSARGHIYVQEVTYGEAEKAELLFKSTPEQVVAAIAHEKEAIDDYAELEARLRAEGKTAEADIVHEIRNDELDHLDKFVAMLKKMSGSC